MNTKAVQSNFTNPNINPCIEESHLVNKCLEKTNYNYSECNLYFENYNNCKKFWHSIYLSRKHAGIKPMMPDADERNYIRSETEKGNRVYSYQNNSK